MYQLYAHFGSPILESHYILGTYVSYDELDAKSWNTTASTFNLNMTTQVAQQLIKTAIIPPTTQEGRMVSLFMYWNKQATDSATASVVCDSEGNLLLGNVFPQWAVPQRRLTIY